MSNCDVDPVYIKPKLIELSIDFIILKVLKAFGKMYLCITSLVLVILGK